MTKGDRVFYYHTGNEKAMVGTARVAAAPVLDPNDPDGKLHVVELACDAPLPAPVTLKAIKADARFADFALVRVARLSVMPVTDEQWRWLKRWRLAAGASGLADARYRHEFRVCSPIRPRVRTHRRLAGQRDRLRHVGHGRLDRARTTTSRCASLHRAVELGCTFFDTAWAYGQGHSERLLGELRARASRTAACSSPRRCRRRT